VWPTLTRARPDIAAHRFHRVSSIVGPSRNNTLMTSKFRFNQFTTNRPKNENYYVIAAIPGIDFTYFYVM